MKRTEMLDEIVCCLLTHAATYPQFPISNLLEAAEAILTMQEEKGMLPPYIQFNVKPHKMWEPEENT